MVLKVRDDGFYLKKVFRNGEAHGKSGGMNGPGKIV
jgi:hypothetical protein